MATPHEISLGGFHVYKQLKAISVNILNSSILYRLGPFWSEEWPHDRNCQEPNNYYGSRIEASLLYQ